MSNKKIFWTDKKIQDWKGVENLGEELFPRQQALGKTKKWIFRAERSGQNLKTNLEEKFKLNGIKDKNKGESEIERIREFQRKAALYLEREPDKDDILEWLAIMRHHGAPTRLLDWTYSFYIAVYFALAENNKGIVWALDASTINRPELIVKKICEQEDGFRKFSKALLHYLKQCDFLGIQSEGDKLIDPSIACHLMKYPIKCVYPVNPFRLNKRLSVQQGLFLMPGDITKSFAENLIETFGGFEKTKKYLWRVKITSDTAKRSEILKKLKDMNISNEALFPGLDGFAKSVGEGLAYPN